MAVASGGYATFRNFVYLGVTTKAAKRRAALAGLIVVTAKQYRKLHEEAGAGTRLMYCGIWYDTVRY